MPNPFRQMMNNHALGQVVRPVYNPDVALAIGDAEDLRPQNIPVHMESGYKMDIVTPVISEMDQLREVGWGRQLEESDFPHTGYLGEALMP